MKSTLLTISLFAAIALAAGRHKSDYDADGYYKAHGCDHHRIKGEPLEPGDSMADSDVWFRDSRMRRQIIPLPRPIPKTGGRWWWWEKRTVKDHDA